MLSVLPVVMLVAAVAVLIGVIAVAMGRGGELAFFQPDYAPLKLDEISATDIALFRPPMAVWGYSLNVTDEALTRIAAAVTERDIEIATLQRQVADLQAAARRRAYGPADRPDSAGFQGEQAATQPPARSVWQPSQPAAETQPSSDWAALPRRSPTAGDDEDDQ
jgi:hypothetical protein